MGIVYDTVYNHMLHRLSQLSWEPHSFIVTPTRVATAQAIQSTDLYNYWTKHASNDPRAEMQGAAVTCYIPTGR